MTQSDSILEYLKQGGSLTPADAYKMFGCLSLSQRFGELSRDEELSKVYEFHSELVEVVGMYGRMKHVARYWITRKGEQLEMSLNGDLR